MIVELMAVIANREHRGVPLYYKVTYTGNMYQNVNKYKFVQYQASMMMKRMYKMHNLSFCW